MPRRMKRAQEVVPGDILPVGNARERVTQARIVPNTPDGPVVHFIHREPGRVIEWSEPIDALLEVDET